jgi:hypothetical protein
MKVTTILLFALAMMSSVIATKHTEELKLTYDGYEDGVYYFSEDDNSYEFQNIEPKVLEKYDLKSEKYVGEKFNTTYKIEIKKDDDDEEYETWTILKLELIKK